MPKMPEFGPIDYLIDRLFPKSLDASSSPFADNAAQARFRKREKQVEAFVRDLKKKSKEEIDALVREERAKAAAAEELRRQNGEARLWFNLPSNSADFEHWSRAAYWTLDEGIALSFGREPSRVNWEAIKSHRQVSPFVASYEKRLELAKRAAAMEMLYKSNPPSFFLGWAKRNAFEVPAQLLELVEQNGQAIADWPGLLDMANQRTKDALAQGERQQNELMDAWEKNLAKITLRVDELIAENKVLRAANAVSQPTLVDGIGERERESLLKMVIGMAIRGYGHDPKASRTRTAREIADDLLEKGISLDEDTVRKYLQQAAELLPPPETEKDGR